MAYTVRRFRFIPLGHGTLFFKEAGKLFGWEGSANLTKTTTNFTKDARWFRLPRPESGGGSVTAFSEGRRLRGVRAGAGAGPQKHPTRLLAYCVMPNHWHMVLWPEQDGQLTAFLRWLTNTRTMRWHARYHTWGLAICTRAVSRRSRSMPTITCTRCSARSSVIRSTPTWSSVPRSGAGRVCGGGARATRERTHPYGMAC